MWISTKTWLREKEDSITLRVERDVVKQANTQMESTISFLAARLTQIEKERAQLLLNYMGIKVDVPVYEREEKIKSGPENPLNALPNFYDMGDDEATKQGVDWNSDGELTYK